MLQQNHIQAFKKWQKYMPSEKERIFLKYDITKCIPLIYYFINNYNIDNPEKLKGIIHQYSDMILTDFMRSTYIDSRLYELQGMKSILKNPAIIDREYENIKNNPNTHIVYTADLRRSQRLIIVNALAEIAELEKFVDIYDITPNTNIKNVVIHHEDPDTIKDIVKLSIKMLNKPNLKDKILLMIETEVKDCEAFIRENEKKSLKSIGMFFESLGYTNRYLDIYKTQSLKYGFDSLDYDIKSDETSDKIGVQSLFEDEKFLDSLPLEDLCLLDASWCNKFAKEWDDFSTAFTAINSLDLWQDILDGKTDFFISNSSLDACIKKSRFLSQLSSETFNMHQNKISSAELKKGTEFDLPLSEDYTSYYIKLHNFIGDNYRRCFSDLLTNNEFIEDLSFSSTFSNLKSFAYQKKLACIEPIIKANLDGNVYKNWGLIRNEILGGKMSDSIDTNRSKLLFAFDVEGFDMPFWYHLDKDHIIDLAKLSITPYMVPEYQGKEDFISYNEESDTYENITSPIIMPIPKSHKKIIIDNANIDGPMKNFWEHKYFLMNGKFPKHLTQTIQKSKKQTVTSRLPITYTNLKTGKQYRKEKNQFIEVDDDNVR